MIGRISENLGVLTVLRALGIDPPARGRMKCPIHGGDGENFQVMSDGQGWKCFSHDCGAGHRRDAVTLYCLIRHGRAFRDLDATTKGAAIRELADLAGVDLEGPELNRPKNKFDRDMTHEDRARLKDLFKNTALLDGEHGHADTYKSRTAQRTILFLAVAKSMNQLPKVVNNDWFKSQDFKDFLNGKYS